MSRDRQERETAGEPDVAVLGRRIRELRKQRGWSLRQLAERAGISHTHVGQIESGAVPEPSVLKISRIARALNTSPANLVDVERVSPIVAPALDRVRADLNILEALDPGSVAVVAALTAALRERAERSAKGRGRRARHDDQSNENPVELGRRNEGSSLYQSG